MRGPPELLRLSDEDEGVLQPPMRPILGGVLEGRVHPRAGRELSPDIFSVSLGVYCKRYT